MPRLQRDEALRILEAALRRLGDERALAALQSLTEERVMPPPTIADVRSALLQNEDTLRLVFSLERDPMSLFDPATERFIEVNQAWVDLYGFSREEVAEMRVADVSAEAAASSSAIAGARKGEGARIDLRWHKKKDGTVFPVEITCGKLDLGGRPIMYAAMRDIASRVRAEEALARSEASFRALIESMPDSVVVHRHGEIVYINPSARKLLGHKDGEGEEMVGTSVVELIHPEDREMVKARIERLVTEGTQLPLVEERVVRRDGEILVLEVSAMATVFDGSPSAIAICRDVSQRKRMEAELLTADRLASIGRLAASVGHEINNPLAYVLGNVTLMQRELAKADLPPEIAASLGERLDIVREGSERMRDIVRELKTLARPDDELRCAVDVARVLDVCTDMAAHEIRHRARLVKEYAPGLHVLATEARLGQLFLNLLVNAGLSIPEGDASTHEVRITARADGESVAIEVSDTGPAVPTEDLVRIFEPFFATKGPRSGGIGLSICHHIVTSLGGTIDAVPIPSGGIAFRVSLPATDAPASGR